jgi:hypothetical protein
VHSRDDFLVVLSRVIIIGRSMMRKMGNQSRVRDFRRVVVLLLLFSRHFFSISSSLVVQISMILLLFATFIVAVFVLLGASILEELSLLRFLLNDVQAKNLRSTQTSKNEALTSKKEALTP